MMRRRSSSSSRNTTVRSPYPSPPLPQPSPIRATRSRLILVWGVLLLAMVALALNLLRIQVLQASTLREQAKAQQMVFLGPIVPRRSIVDRSGTVLAIDTPVYTLYAHPLLFKNSKETIAEDLAGILDQPAEQLVSQLSQGESGIRIVDNLSEDIAKQITELQQDGLELIQAQQRLYPQQDLFANIVGYVNLDRQGQSGVEYTLENQLQQPLGAMQLSRSGDGTIIPVGLPSDFMQHQRDDLRLELTLDSRLQRATRFALKQQMEKYSAKRGAVVVMDVHDGSILSLVSEPSYDPNKYYQADMERLRNWVLTDLYEPGSTFKPINLAIALQAGTIQPEDSFFDEGAIEVGGWPIQNNDFEDTGARGDLSVPEILQYSSNVGMVRIMQTLQPGLYYGWLDRLKLNEPTGIDLPSEATGYLKSYEQFTGAIIEPATAAFGQGFSLTPIKLIQLHSMLANGGKMVVPHVVRGLTAPGGTLDWQPAIDPPRQVFSPQITQTVLTMMEQVVLEGTGEAAQIAGYRIAGKTGTAQKASSGGGYIDGARITSFVGIFPVEAPRYAVLAVVDEPQGEDAYGSTVAAPIVKSVMETLISIEQIAPSEPVTQEWNTDNRQEIPGNYAIEPENDPWVDESSSNQYSDQYTDEYTDEYSDQYTDEYSDQYTDEYSEDDSEDYLEDSPESFSEDYTEDYSEDASDASDGL
ncbi:MAG: penicillin-binding protein 2 [Cyanobacteria bacterium RU_5_0]|nr:penicillin-binding protein 2 [Cyanobacteria bacterium RU_5_0]